MRVELEGISKSFGKTKVIPKLDLNIHSNQLTVLVGPSGCGKSTLLRIIAGLEEPDEGSVFFDRECVDAWNPYQRGIGMVFQSYALYPHMTVFENLRFGLGKLRLGAEEEKKRIQQTAELLSIGAYLDRKPKQLSGGQRQRVAMGRALVRNPKIFLFDEPLSNLDAALRTKMRLEIARLRNEMQATAVYVTHDQVEAMTLADTLVVLQGGNVIQQGAPVEVYHRPCNKFVASFLGSPAMNFLPVSSATQSAVKLPDGNTVKVTRSETITQVGIRPEHLSVNSQAPNQIQGRVWALEHLGAETLVHLHVGGDADLAPSVAAKLPAESAPGRGSEITLGFKSEHCHFFDRNENAVFPV